MENVRGEPQREWLRVGGGLWFKGLVALVVGLLLSRAFFLQLLLGDRQFAVAEGNRLEHRPLIPDRGAIRDREGRVLVRNIVQDGKVVREYPYGETAAHVVGYVGEISAEELEQQEEFAETLAGMVVGKIGIERAFNRELTGTIGEEIVETDARGEDLRVVGRREGVPGEVVDLTLDAELNKKTVEVLSAYEAEKGKIKGAVVVSKLSSGEVLGLVSWPSFDPNLFSGLPGEGNYQTKAEVLSDKERQPMFDKAIAGSYPPGSIYKLVTATAGLADGKIDEDTTVIDEGEIKIGSYRYGNWYFDDYGRTEGELDLMRALARSNDIFFYKVGEWVGVEKLSWWSRKLGLGKYPGLGLGSESSGRVPEPLWKEKLTGERWFLGNTYHMAIGQGDIEVTPLQANLMTAAVVSGKWCRPRLRLDSQAECEDVGVERDDRELIIEGMKQACSSGGTAFSFFDFEPRVACKTGTAQHGGEDDDPHAWITVVVPDTEGSYETGVVITVLLEAAGQGSEEAGPVALKIARFVVDSGLN